MVSHQTMPGLLAAADEKGYGVTSDKTGVS